MDHYTFGGFPGGSVVKNPPAKAGDAGDDPWFWSLSREDPLEKEKATYSSILAWEIPWTEEPGELRSPGSQSQTQLSYWAHTHNHYYIVNYILCTYVNMWFLKWDLEMSTHAFHVFVFRVYYVNEMACYSCKSRNDLSSKLKEFNPKLFTSMFS